jgi:multidrug efflux pump subunit AcrA (membrane-fusion protein)
MSLPLSAISFDRIGKASVKAVDAQGIVKKIPVRTGYISDDYVQITSNLPDSLLVISKADALVREGDKVKPVL